MAEYDWTQKIWNVIQSDPGVDLTNDDRLQFGPENSGILVPTQNNGTWGGGCHYQSEYGGQVTYNSQTYDLTYEDQYGLLICSVATDSGNSSASRWIGSPGSEDLLTGIVGVLGGIAAGTVLGVVLGVPVPAALAVAAGAAAVGALSKKKGALIKKKLALIAQNGSTNGAASAATWIASDGGYA